MYISQLESASAIARCCLLTLKNGQQCGFSNYDHDFIVDGVVYYANASDVSAISQSIYQLAESYEFHSSFAHNLITVQNALSGLYDDAKIETFIVDLSDFTKKIWSKSGYIREIKIEGDKIIASVCNMTSILEKNIGNSYSSTCRACFGDQYCKVNHVLFDVKACVVDVPNNQTVIIDREINNAGLYEYGRLSVIGLGYIGTMMIESRKITTLTPFRGELERGVEIIISAGCNKSFKMCQKIYNNAINFRGEPHVPTNSAIL